MSQDNLSAKETGLEIGVIGIAGKFPGANNIAEFWANLQNGVESISSLRDEEVLAAGVDRELMNNPHYVKAGGFLRGIENFDASFFDYSPREAQLMDPQYRLLHECVWEALEDAGYCSQDSDDLVGVYAGASNNIYWTTAALQHMHDSSELFQTMILNDHSFTTRISYKLNLQGPSLAVQTACSSSLVAIHLACQSLLSGETDIAAAGGVSINLPSKTGYLYQEGMISSPDGHCRPFDAQAGGTIFSDGVGIVVLKRLQEAITDGDHIYAVIRGSAINNDGNQKVGYTAPGMRGQAAVIKAALNMAEIEPESISYIEAHGTGTPVGDPIEIEALKAAFHTEQQGYCQIGSVKSNIGHLDAASGVAGFLKTVLALQHRQIPPTLHFTEPNPQIDFAHSPFEVVTHLTPWHSERFPLRAGVSSFGIGGTNAHVILEEAPAVPASPMLENNRWHLLLLSAKSATALRQMEQRLADDLQAYPHRPLGDVAYTLQVGRASFAHRRLLVCSSTEQAIAELRREQVDPALRGYVQQTNRPHYWLFPGQGAQYRDMGRHLYERETVFREALDHCLELAEACGAGTLLPLLYPETTGNSAGQALQETEVVQPLLFSIEYALAQLLWQWGLRPQGMLGHSIGEYVAACLAGVFTLEEAMCLVVRRGQVMSHSFHEAMIAEFEREVRRVRLQMPQMPYISNVSGRWIKAEEATHPDYWVQHLRQQAPQGSGIDELLAVEAAILLEIGVDSSLSDIVQKEHVLGDKQIVLNLLGQPQEEVFAEKNLLNCLGQLWIAGAKIDWALVNGHKGRRLSLPTYPFEHQPYWDVMRHATPLSEYQRKMSRDTVIKVPSGRSTDELIESIRHVVKTHFGFTTINVYDNFFDLGATSLDVSLLGTMLSDTLGQEIPLVSLYTYPSVHALASYLSGSDEAILPSTVNKAFLETDISPRKPAIGKTGVLERGIAVIGMSGRFPGAANVQTFWHNIANAVESISTFSVEELIAAGVPKELAENPNYVKAKGILADIEYFDANFFDYAPKEAEIMDPQFRLLHECAWEALEDAGYDPLTYQGLIGVYSGTSPTLGWFARLGEKLMGTEQFGTMLLNDREFFSTTLSYKLNLRGPSITMQTACSTALVNIASACQALLSGECHLALAGGVTVSLPSKAGYLYQEGMINSPDGHCRPFDAQAAGTVFGDGAGIVVLKRLQEAITDGDHIYAVIRGSAINNDGNQKVGYTAPGTRGQAAVIRSALRVAEVEPESISYIEAHGTGTPMGDPIEIEALKAAFHTEQQGYCQIGSVKSNIGHLNAASGVAGFLKTVLALQHRQIPPTLHFTQANPQIDFAHSPFEVVTRLTPWHSERFPLRAGVSSFGIGGTNAHVILEEAPAVPTSPTPENNRWHLLLLSAKSATALTQMGQRLADDLQAHPHRSLGDVAYTLQVGRASFAHRRLVVCASTEQAVAELRQEVVDPALLGYVQQTNRPLYWLFPGQGAQYRSMGRHLYERETVFREVLDHCLELAEMCGAGTLLPLLYPEPLQEVNEQALQETEVAQPLLFSIEYALAQLLWQWGLRPQGMLGHSIGEYVAACLAGVFSLEEAMRLVVRRGQVMSRAPRGVMVSVDASEEQVQRSLGEGVSLAAVNTPEQCVLSGSQDLIERVEQQWEREGRRFRRVATSHAFHSALMDPVLAEFAQEVSTISLQAPKLPYLSNVSGTWIRPEEATDPAYWVKHLRQTVRFSEGMGHLLAEPQAVLLEVGPGKSLSTFARKGQGATREQMVLNLLRHQQEEQDDEAYLLRQLGRLWVTGGKIDWAEYQEGKQHRRLSLPTYPFERQRFWLEEENALRRSFEKKQRNKKNEHIDEWFYLPGWQRSIIPVLDENQHPSCWLLFQNKFGPGAQMTETLMDKGLDVIRVDSGSRYTQVNAGHYIINPSSANDYVRLIKALSDTGKKPEAIVHMWNILPDAHLSFEEAQILGYYSLVYLAQAISAQKHYANLTISVVTNNLVEVTGCEILSPEKSTVFGPCKVIPQEYSNIRCKNIDVDFIEGQNVRLVAKKIFEEVANRASDPVVAYRGNHRWVQEFSQVHLGAANTALFEDKGVYFIIGGLGRIGLVLASYLAKHHQARLVLSGKSWFPAREEWDAWIDKKPADDTIVQRIHAIRQLEQYGSEVIAVRADIAREEDMQHVIDDIERRYGRINGVIHSAGLPGGDTFRAIQQINHGIDEEQFTAKMHGINVLEKVLRGKHIDFCLLFSSVASILGGLGFCAYTAANQYLDTFVQKHNQEHAIPWLCINWDAWDFSGGLDISATLGGSIFAAAIVPAKEGEEVFQRISHSGFHNQLLVSTLDLQERIDTWIHLTGTQNSSADQATTSFARPDLSNPYIEPVNDMEKKLVELWKTFFRIAQIGIHDNFFELGASSLDAIQITHLLKENLELNIPIVTIFTYPTIALLSSHLTSENELTVEDTREPEERIEEKQRIQMRRLRRMQEDE